jgi:hypothetical protein
VEEAAMKFLGKTDPLMLWFFPLGLTILFILWAVAGCSIKLGGGTTTEQRTLRWIDDGTFIQDGMRWNCIVTKEEYPDRNLNAEPWRKLRKGVCYEVK